MNAKEIEWLQALAREGARARLEELNEERERLLATFPDLGRKPRPATITKAIEARVIYEGESPSRKKEAKRLATTPTPPEVKERAIKLLREGKLGLKPIAREAGVTETTIRRWERQVGHKAPRQAGHRAPHRDNRPARQRAFKQRRAFDYEYKIKAVEIAKAKGVVAAARELGIPPASVSNWVTGRGIGEPDE